MKGILVTQPPADQPPRHPGYGPTPPGAEPAPSPSQQAYPAHPGYGAPTPPAYAAQQGYTAAAQPGYPPTSSPRAAARNPLGLASLVIGALAPLLGLLFLFIQAGALRAMSGDIFGAVNTVHTVLDALIGLAAVILGLVALSKRGASKTLAAAGIALGAATLVGVLGAIIYPVLVQLMYM